VNRFLVANNLAGLVLFLSCTQISDQSIVHIIIRRLPRRIFPMDLPQGLSFPRARNSTHESPSTDVFEHNT
jgi:hypothetical protein